MSQRTGVLDHDGCTVAYAEVGAGPPLVVPGYWVSHVGDDWARPGYRRFLEGLARGRRVIRYDRPGTGLSDRARPAETLTLRVRGRAAPGARRPARARALRAGRPASIPVSAPTKVVLRAPSTVTARRGGDFVYVTVRASRRTPLVLCWRTATARRACERSRGVWRVKLPASIAKQVLVLKAGRKVVARKPVCVRLKA